MPNPYIPDPFRFAMVTADSSNDVCFRIGGNQGDSTSFLSWIGHFTGRHFSFEAMRRDATPLLNYDCVVFSGNPGFIRDIIHLTAILKGRAVTVWLPEGDATMYNMGINQFHPLTFEAMNACDRVYCMEEDLVDYYRALLRPDHQVGFVHVPLTDVMASGDFLLPRAQKADVILVYGDNNPNCPITACAVARMVNKPVKTVCISPEKIEQLKQTFQIDIPMYTGKLPQHSFLHALGTCRYTIYPTRNVGSARQPIAAAVAGTPCIGSDQSHTQRRLWPSLSCGIYDVKRMAQLIERLDKDEQFYQSVVDQAFRGLEFYNLKNTVRRFFELLALKSPELADIHRGES